MTIVTSLTKPPLLLNKAKPRPHSVSENGFVLILVIWVLAGLSLMVAFMASQLDELQTMAFENEQFSEQRRVELSIQSTALYLAATRTYSYAGLRTEPYIPTQLSAIERIDTDVYSDRGDELRLDNRPYLSRQGLEFRLQDAGSMISLRSDGLLALQALLESYDLGRAEVERLLATLKDYTDRDGVTSLSGAEKSQYLRQGMLPPTNRFLVSPRQLGNVMGWREVLERHPSILDEVTIYVADRENYNSMTPRAIRVQTPNAERETVRIVEGRQSASFRKLEQVHALTGNLYSRDVFSLAFVPSRYLRITLTPPGRRNTRLIGITLTPDSNLAPWEIDYSFQRPLLAEHNAMDTMDETGKLESTTPPTTLL